MATSSRTPTHVPEEGGRSSEGGDLQRDQVYIKLHGSGATVDDIDYSESDDDADGDDDDDDDVEGIAAATAVAGGSADAGPRALSEEEAGACGYPGAACRWGSLQ